MLGVTFLYAADASSNGIDVSIILGVTFLHAADASSSGIDITLDSDGKNLSTTINSSEWIC